MTFSNSKQEHFLSNLPTISVESKKRNISEKIKFNFSYLDESNDCMKKISQLTQKESRMIIDKLRHLSGSTKTELLRKLLGKNRKAILEIYGEFPKKSSVKHPKHVPHDVEWARIRLEWDFRLGGFFIPKKLDGKKISKDHYLDTNTFYLVFIDYQHKFYKS